MAVIVISTVRQHIDTGHYLTARCPRCDRRVTVDLAALVERGLADVSVTAIRHRFRCRDCGTPGEVFLHPPVPSFIPNDPRYGATWRV